MSNHHRTERFIGKLSRNQNDEVVQVETYPNTRHSSLYVSTDDKIEGTASNALYQNNNKLVRQDISKIGLKTLHLDYCIPNVNSKNNVLKLNAYPDGVPTATVYDVIIPTNNYTTTILLLDAIITALNAVVPITFSYTIEDCVVTLTSTGTFQFLDCPGINFGSSVHGLFYTNSPVTSVESMKIVPKLQYTSFVDVVVTELGNARITSDTFSGTQLYNTNDHFARIFVDETTVIPRIINREIQNIQFIPYRHRTITSFQITLYDEFSSILYSEVQTIGGDLIEIPLVKYELKFNLIS